MSETRLTSDGEWMPSRFRFALFRLVGFIKLTGKEPRIDSGPDRSLLLAPAPEQTRLETYTTLIVTFILATLYALEMIAPSPTLGEAARRAPVAILLASLAWHALLLVGGFLATLLAKLRIRRKTRLDMITSIHLVILTTIAAWVASRPSTLRWSGIVWLAFVLANTLAAIVLWLLRERVKTLEERWRESVFEARF